MFVSQGVFLPNAPSIADRRPGKTSQGCEQTEEQHWHKASCWFVGLEDDQVLNLCREWWGLPFWGVKSWGKKWIRWCVKWKEMINNPFQIEPKFKPRVKLSAGRFLLFYLKKTNFLISFITFPKWNLAVADLRIFPETIGGIADCLLTGPMTSPFRRSHVFRTFRGSKVCQM